MKNGGTAYAMTGSFSVAFKSGAIAFASGAAFMGIGSEAFGQSFGGSAHIARSLAHGMVGGIGSVLQGGKFGHGFASAGLTKFINVNAAFDKAGMGNVRFDGARIAAAAILGGTISDATGGKFANGAMTAAMGQALNGNPQNAREQKVARIQRGDLTEAERTALVRRIGIERQHVSEILDAVLAGDSGAAHLFYDGFSASGDILDSTRLGAISNTLYSDAFRLTQSSIGENLSGYTDTFFNETFGLTVGGRLGFSPLGGAATTVNGIVTTNWSATRIQADVSCHASGRCGYSINGISTQIK